MIHRTTHKLPQLQHFDSVSELLNSFQNAIIESKMLKLNLGSDPILKLVIQKFRVDGEFLNNIVLCKKDR